MNNPTQKNRAGAKTQKLCIVCTTQQTGTTTKLGSNPQEHTQAGPSRAGIAGRGWAASLDLGVPRGTSLGLSGEAGCGLLAALTEPQNTKKMHTRGSGGGGAHTNQRIREGGRHYSAPQEKGFHPTLSCGPAHPTTNWQTHTLRGAR